MPIFTYSDILGSMLTWFNFKKQLDYGLQLKAGEVVGFLIILLLLDWLHDMVVGYKGTICNYNSL